MPGYTIAKAGGDSPVPTFALGDYVKLMFIDPAGAESMWVSVTGNDGGRLAGTLANTPLGIAGLDFGDEVQFGPESIISARAGGDDGA